MITMKQKSRQYQRISVTKGSTVTAAEPKESIATTRKNDLRIKLGKEVYLISSLNNH